MTIVSLYEQITKLNTDDIIEQSMDDTAQAFADKQREQLSDGYSSQGTRLKKYANAAYAARKNRLNPVPGFGNPDHKLKGDYHKGIFMTVQNGKVVTGSQDFKTPFLEKRDPNSLGLGGPYKADYLEFDLSPEIQRNITKATGLGFGRR